MSSKIFNHSVGIVCLMWAAGLAWNWRPASATADSPAGAAAATDPYAHLPATLDINATIRDFKGKNETRGHPDFEAYSNSYITTGLVETTLSADGKPVFKGRAGKQIKKEFKDRSGNIINPAFSTTTEGDAAGELENSSNQLTSAADFAKWYVDDAATNASKSIHLTFNRVANTNRYVFDSEVDPACRTNGGFFPINNELFGNFGSTNKNFHFTTEIDTTFTYKRDQNMTFKFTGDDDVWVFIDNKLALDLGGLHSKKEQSVALNRLPWLSSKDGQKVTLKVFHAERHTTQSNFRIETTIQLENAELPVSSGLSD